MRRARRRRRIAVVTGPERFPPLLERVGEHGAGRLEFWVHNPFIPRNTCHTEVESIAHNRRERGDGGRHAEMADDRHARAGRRGGRRRGRVHARPGHHRGRGLAGRGRVRTWRCARDAVRGRMALAEAAPTGRAGAAAARAAAARTPSPIRSPTRRRVASPVGTTCRTARGATGTATPGRRTSGASAGPNGDERRDTRHKVLRRVSTTSVASTWRLRRRLPGRNRTSPYA